MEEVLNKKEGSTAAVEAPHDPKDYIESKKSESEKKVKTIIFFIGFVIVIGIGVVAYFFWTEIKQKLAISRGGESCQADAKICPDGTTLSRTLPGCQFPSCPGGEKGLDITYWQEHSSEELALDFKYPEDWKIKSEEMGLLELVNSKNENQKIMMLKTSASSPEALDMDLFEARDIEAGGYKAKREVFRNKKDKNKYYLRIFIREKGIIATADSDKSNLAEMSLIFENIIFSIQFNDENAAAENLKMDSDADGLYDFEEAEYKTDPAKADSDGDGYNDGDELKNFYNPAGEGKLAEDWSTPAGAVAAFEKARSNCQEEIYREKIYFSEDFYQPIIDMAIKQEGFSGQEVQDELNNFYKEIENNKEEIKDEFLKEYVAGRVYANNISAIQLLGKKIIDKNNIAYKYKVAYSPDNRGYAPEPEEKNVYLTKINNEWQLDFKNHIKFMIEDELLLNEAREKARDAARISDIKQIQTALELYFNDAKRYPESIAVGGRIEFNKITYMSVVPDSPEFEKGDCTLEKNNYTYTVKNNGKEYELSYCLESDIGGVSKGVNIATPSGLTDESKNKTLQPEYRDCRREADKDAARLSDIKQIQTALELYYNEANKYPESISGGDSIKFNKTVYMQKIPTNPAPTTDICKGYENYSYKQENKGMEYKLVYCLEKNAGGITAGPHTATPSGLE